MLAGKKVRRQGGYATPKILIPRNNWKAIHENYTICHLPFILKKTRVESDFKDDTYSIFQNCDPRVNIIKDVYIIQEINSFP